MAHKDTYLGTWNQQTRYKKAPTRAQKGSNFGSRCHQLQVHECRNGRRQRQQRGQIMAHKGSNVGTSWRTKAATWAHHGSISQQRGHIMVHKASTLGTSWPTKIATWVFMAHESTIMVTTQAHHGRRMQQLRYINCT
ncbi:hypothetical protein Fot_37563 [Forsythia ovata]|uniref:Uncharacterized protein n=1 Tax=Forsythia ovata TaxID=205694 RepID=A0ABD1RZB8_9LAMI